MSRDEGGSTTQRRDYIPTSMAGDFKRKDREADAGVGSDLISTAVSGDAVDNVPAPTKSHNPTSDDGRGEDAEMFEDANKSGTLLQIFTESMASEEGKKVPVEEVTVATGAGAEVPLPPPGDRVASSRTGERVEAGLGASGRPTSVNNVPGGGPMTPLDLYSNNDASAPLLSGKGQEGGGRVAVPPTSDGTGPGANTATPVSGASQTASARPHSFTYDRADVRVSRILPATLGVNGAQAPPSAPNNADLVGPPRDQGGPPPPIPYNARQHNQGGDAQSANNEALRNATRDKEKMRARRILTDRYEGLSSAPPRAVNEAFENANARSITVAKAERRLRLDGSDNQTHGSQAAAIAIQSRFRDHLERKGLAIDSISQVAMGNNPMITRPKEKGSTIEYSENNFEIARDGNNYVITVNNVKTTERSKRGGGSAATQERTDNYRVTINRRQLKKYKKPGDSTEHNNNQIKVERGVAEGGSGDITFEEIRQGEKWVAGQGTVSRGGSLRTSVLLELNQRIKKQERYETIGQILSSPNKAKLGKIIEEDKAGFVVACQNDSGPVEEITLDYGGTTYRVVKEGGGSQEIKVYRGRRELQSRSSIRGGSSDISKEDIITVLSNRIKDARTTKAPSPKKDSVVQDQAPQDEAPDATEDSQPFFKRSWKQRTAPEKVGVVVGGAVVAPVALAVGIAVGAVVAIPALAYLAFNKVKSTRENRALGRRKRDEDAVSMGGGDNEMGADLQANPGPQPSGSSLNPNPSASGQVPPLPTPTPLIKDDPLPTERTGLFGRRKDPSQPKEIKKVSTAPTSRQIKDSRHVSKKTLENKPLKKDEQKRPIIKSSQVTNLLGIRLPGNVKPSESRKIQQSNWNKRISHVNIEGADFGNAELYNANFTGCHFKNCDLSKIAPEIFKTINFSNCTFANVTVPEKDNPITGRSESEEDLRAAQNRFRQERNVADRLLKIDRNSDSKSDMLKKGDGINRESFSQLMRELDSVEPSRRRTGREIAKDRVVYGGNKISSEGPISPSPSPGGTGPAQRVKSGVNRDPDNPDRVSGNGIGG